MENFKSVLFLIIVLIIVATLGYSAFITLEPGNVNVERQKNEELTKTNKAFEEKIQELTDELESMKEKVAFEEQNKEESLVKNETPATSFKYQSLINELQELIDDNTFMKEKSRGSRVGTVQTFLNLYNKTKKRVDNDYGASTKNDVISFQKKEGLTADGEAGPTTFQKMIDWLKKQS